MTDAEPTVFLNDQFVPASQASINIYDLGIVLGATLTEMTRTFAHKSFRLEDHVARLRDGYGVATDCHLTDGGFLGGDAGSPAGHNPSIVADRSLTRRPPGGYRSECRSELYMTWSSHDVGSKAVRAERFVSPFVPDPVGLRAARRADARDVDAGRHARGSGAARHHL